MKSFVLAILSAITVITAQAEDFRMTSLPGKVARIINYDTVVTFRLTDLEVDCERTRQINA